MLTRENYLGDPKKMVNQPTAAAFQQPQESYPRGGGFRGGNMRGGRRFDGGYSGNRGYTDYDDPSRYQN